MITPQDPAPTLDLVLHHIISSNNHPQLNNTIRSSLPKDVRETILSSATTSGQDPLTVLDVRDNTLGMLYIMSARLRTNTSPPPPFSLIAEFCHRFSPDQARLAPDRVTTLAKGIKRLAEDNNNPKLAIEPLHDLLTRYPYDLSYLTTIHPIFLRVCVATHHFSAALPILSHPITAIDTSLCDLNYNDNLVYHYTGGIALAALKQWTEAEEFFEICVSSPGQAPAAIQMEALKKLILVQLISRGTTTSLPKYTNQNLLRLYKATPYHQFVQSYPHQPDKLNSLLEKEKNTFITDKNMGLVEQALERAPRWAIKKLTGTYLTLALHDISKAVKIDNQDHVRSLVLSMIESSEISAQISADGTVTFSDPPPEFTKDQVDGMLQQAHEQSALLARLDMELTRSRDYILKSVRNRDEPWSQVAEEEGIFSSGHGGAPGAWMDDVMFA